MARSNFHQLWDAAFLIVHLLINTPLNYEYSVIKYSYPYKNYT